MNAHRRLILLGITAALPLSLPALANTDAFPSRPITLVVPYTAGGSADTIARHLSQTVSELLKQTVVVDNRSGAGGMIGASAVARAPADGYTVLLATSNLYSINPALYGKSAQTTMSALTPVIHLVEAPIVIVASNGLQAGSFAALLEVARKRPEGLNYGTPGIGTEHHLLGELIAKTAGVKLTHVPYKGAASAVGDLASGQIDMLITLASTAQPAIGTGKAKLVGVASRGTYAALPQAPTVDQTLKGVNMLVSYSVMAPAGTPDTVLKKLNDAFQKALDRPEVRAKIQEAGYSPTGGSIEYFARRIIEERQQREPIITEAHIKPE
jgi:tripartite-type tricarboxylate transporter receptor subunit TctC